MTGELRTKTEYIDLICETSIDPEIAEASINFKGDNISSVSAVLNALRLRNLKSASEN